MDTVSLLLSISVGVFVTSVCLYLLGPVALHIGLVDMPGGRKKHVHPVPLIGGIAIFLGFCFSLLCLNISLQHFRGLLAGSAILLLIGVMDDFRELTPRIRLVGQCLAAVLLIQWGHLSIVQLGNLFFLKSIQLSWFSLPFTVFFVLAYINAVNMIDGNDGLAGMVVLGESLFLIGLFARFHQIDNMDVLILLGAPLCVFLRFNLPFFSEKRASIFLGDAGSTLLGFVMVWFAIALSQVLLLHRGAGLPTYNPLTVLWILAYPLFDLTGVIWHRLRAGKSPFSAGRDHLHHLLFDRGLSRGSVTLILFAVSVCLGGIGVTLAELQVTESWQFIIFLTCFLAYFLVSMQLMLYCTRLTQLNELKSVL